MAQSTDVEKYEALGVIGIVAQSHWPSNKADNSLGKGSFGIIRKVRRVADSHVRTSAMQHPTIER